MYSCVNNYNFQQVEACAGMIDQNTGDIIGVAFKEETGFSINKDDTNLMVLYCHLREVAMKRFFYTHGLQMKTTFSSI